MGDDDKYPRPPGMSDREYAIAMTFADHTMTCHQCNRVTMTTGGRTAATAKLLCPIGRALDSTSKGKAPTA